MALEPVDPAKMTPADIERERQAFREHHAKSNKPPPKRVGGDTLPLAQFSS